MTHRLLGALQFLTVIPIRTKTASPGDSSVFFPVTGALLGTSAGFILQLLRPHLGPSIASLIALVWLLVITGCLHEDGLADVADALRVGRTKEKMMSVLKDSRIGVFGGLALIASVLLRWQALVQTMVRPLLCLAASLALARGSMVILAGTTPAASPGLGEEFARGCSRLVVIATVLQTIATSVIVMLLAGWRYGVAMLLANTAVILLLRIYFLRRLGGVNGDCLGATSQAVEMVTLVTLAWHRSF